MRRGILAAVVATTVMALLSGCVFDLDRRAEEGLQDEQTDAAFYTLPATLEPGDPGELIRTKPIESAPQGTKAWRVIYHSRDLSGNDIPVSGIVVIPDTVAPDGGRTVVSWAHPTTGSAQKCGPSLDLNPFLLIEGMDELLLAGYAVAATDYQGMSLAGPSSYLLGVTEGNNVLDAARAAHNLQEAGVGETVLLWGHSQGGQAALFAAQQAKAYAPELTIRAVAVAAPAADLLVLMSDDIIDVSGVTIAAYAIPAFTVAYADRFAADQMQAILTPAGLGATPTMAAMCLLSQNKAIHAIADPLIGEYVTSDPSTTEPWATLLKENSAGGFPIGVPVFIAQGLADTLVVPAATENYVAQLCKAGEDVTFDTYPGITHGLIAQVAVPKLLGFFADVMHDKKAPESCRE